MHRYCLLLLIFWSTGTIAQVNLQSGASQINIPLFSYSDNDNLSCAISLNYMNGNGLKVNEVASEVGTGWNLQYGGVIRREQRGLPDDQRRDPLYETFPTNKNMSFEEYNNKYFPNGFLFSTYSSTDLISNEGGYIKMYPLTTNNDNPPTDNGNIPIKESIAADREQDIFHLNYGKGYAKFVIGKNGQIKILNDQKIKVEMGISDYLIHDNIKTCIDFFKVTDDEGIQYIFSTKELSQTLTYNNARFADENGVISLDEDPPRNLGGWNTIGNIPIFIGKKTESYIVTKWYLTKISNPRTGKEILFNYEVFDIDILTDKVASYSKPNNNQDGNLSLTINREVIKAYRIKNIICPSSQFDFVYDNIHRIDLPNSLPIKEIRHLNSAGNLLKKYLFNYGYFYKSEIKPYEYTFNNTQAFYTRLCLLSLQEIGNNDKDLTPSYSFEYYTGGGNSVNIVPPPFSYWTDHWGYYSAKSLYSSEYPQNIVPSNTIRAVSKPVYFNAKVPVSGSAKNGILKQITYPAGGTLNYEYEQNEALFNNGNVTMGGVRTKRTTLYDGSDHSKDLIKEYKYIKDDGTSSSGWGYESSDYAVAKNVRTYRYAGGKLGISAIDIATASITTSLTYFGSPGTGFAQKINAISALPNPALFSILTQIMVAIFTPQEPEFREQGQMIYTNISNQSINPLPFQYSRIEIIENKLNSEKGKTVYEFTSEEDKPIDIQDFYFPFSNKDRYMPWAYGLPKRVTLFESMEPDNYKILKESIYEYNYKSSFLTDINFMSKKWQANKLIYDEFPSVRVPFDFIGQNNITESIYFPQTGHTELINKKERIYNEDASFFSENQTTYTYNANNYQPKTITTTNSIGDIIQKRIYYPEDYTSGGFITDLIGANIVNIPVSTETWLTKSGEVPQLISTSVSEFTNAPNGDIKLSKEHILVSKKPLKESEIGVFDPDLLIRNPEFIKPQTEMLYDGNGDLIQAVNIPNNIFNSFIYDYKKRHQVALIKNALHKNVAYTSFETEALGGWSLVSGSTIKNQGGITGEHMFSGTLNKTFSETGNYTVTVWVKSNSNVTVNGINGTLLTSIHEWDLFEWKLNSVSSITVIGENYDELRLHPQDARMTTSSFDEFGNKTSECDINNKITYYLYDGFGRIKTIKDERQNVIKAYEYNDKQ